MAQVKPPGTPTAASGGGGVILSWPTSGTAGAGYWVYAATNLASPNWTKLTTGAPLSSLSFTNIGASGTNLYMVRAVAMQTTGSGSYTNLSPRQAMTSTPYAMHSHDATTAATATSATTASMVAATGVNNAALQNNSVTANRR